MIECSKCREDKPEQQFSKKGKRKDGSYKLQPYCKDCQKIVIRAYYQANKEKVKKQVADKKSYYLKKIHIKLCEYLSDNPCSCGESDVTCLDFHHIDKAEKSDEISQLLRKGFGWKKIKLEIDKCKVFCSNCHRKITAEEVNSYKHKFKYGLLV